VDERGNIQSLLVLRKLTRAIASDLRGQLVEHLTALTAVLRPETVFGKLIQGGGQKDWVVKSDQAQRELKELYDRIAPAAPFNLRTDLTPPFDIGGLSLEITPVEYTHVAQGESGGRKITVRCPLAWTLSYKGFAPPAFKQLLGARTRTPADLQRFLLAYLALHLVTKMQPGVMGLLSSLRFPATASTDPELGSLPLTRISVEVATERPSDAVMIESAEVTGMDAFEEVVKVEDIARLRDPLRERLLETVSQHAPELIPR
jgi:hypothetical protein